MTAPLTDERLADIRARHKTAMTPQGYGADHQALMAARSAADVPDLLAALEVAQAEAKALRLERQVLLDERVEVGALRAALNTEEMEPYRDLAHYGKQAHRLGEARAALARVEALAERYEADERSEPYGGEPWGTTAAAIRDALEGKP